MVIQITTQRHAMFIKRPMHVILMEYVMTAVGIMYLNQIKMAMDICSGVTVTQSILTCNVNLIKFRPSSYSGFLCLEILTINVLQRRYARCLKSVYHWQKKRSKASYLKKSIKSHYTFYILRIKKIETLNRTSLSFNP